MKSLSVLNRNGEAWFVLAEVCGVLEVKAEAEPPGGGLLGNRGGHQVERLGSRTTVLEPWKNRWLMGRTSFAGLSLSKVDLPLTVGCRHSRR